MVISASALLALFALLAPASHAGVPAFAGAQGAGAVSAGGRGGRVVEVTNLNDAGEGSLRAAIDASGPRTVVFRTGGSIKLKSALRVRNPYLTIAGQTAPGGGVLLNGSAVVDSGMIMINTHDVVIRFLRVRVGKGSRPYGIGGGITQYGGAYNNIVDHVSISWCTDENLTIWRFAGQEAVRNITFSYVINAEGIQGHSTGFIAGGQDANTSAGVTDVDMHHSMLMNQSHRNPLIKIRNYRHVNNITYNWGFYAAQTVGGVTADYINNLFKAGPQDPKIHEIQVAGTGGGDCPTGSPSIYAAGNQGPNSNSNGANSAMLRQVSGENGSEQASVSNGWVRNSPQDELQYPIVADPVDSLEGLMLADAGASRRLNENGQWLPARDSVDARLIEDYKNERGSTPANENQVGGFPTIDAGTPYTDSDHDGMADAWESAQGLSPNDPSDGNADSDGDGFTNLEEFLNGTNPQAAEDGSPVAMVGAPPALAATPEPAPAPAPAATPAPVPVTVGSSGPAPATGNTATGPFDLQGAAGSNILGGAAAVLQSILGW